MLDHRRVNLLPVWILLFFLSLKRDQSLSWWPLDRSIAAEGDWKLDIIDKRFNQSSSVNEALSSSDYLHAENPPCRDIGIRSYGSLVICFLYFILFFFFNFHKQQQQVFQNF